MTRPFVSRRLLPLRGKSGPLRTLLTFSLVLLLTQLLPLTAAALR